MKPKRVYLALAVAGAVIPYAAFVPWVAVHGLDLRLFVRELFANRIGAFFGLDVLVSAIVLFRFIGVERRRLTLPLWWLPIVGVLCVGVSLGLPLFLCLRELALDKQQDALPAR